jgi:hypothetical protein
MSSGSCPLCADQRASRVLHNVLRPAAVREFARRAGAAARRPPAAHQAQACLARAAAAVHGSALQAGAAGPPARRPLPAAYRTRPAKCRQRVPAFRPVFARIPRAVWSMLYTLAPAILPCVSCARPGMQGQHKQTETAATNSWLFCTPCGRRFVAEAGTRGTCSIETRCMIACPRRCEAKTMYVSVWISPHLSAQTCAAV